MIDPETVWSTDDAVTHDVDPVGTDYSDVNVDSIVEKHFQGASGQPIGASVCAGTSVAA
ncbi:MAG: hypothetical protein V9G04_17005 [Nocardioides sp.]